MKRRRIRYVAAVVMIAIVLLIMWLYSSWPPDMTDRRFGSGRVVSALVFSRDRALQLDGLLRSLYEHTAEPELLSVAVLHKTTSAQHRRQYAELALEWGPRGVVFIEEFFFLHDLRRMLDAAPAHIMFLVDDTIFLRDFSMQQVVDVLHNEEVLGFSLRLGRNTNRCFPLGRSQVVPDMNSTHTRPGTALVYDWTGAEYDFGYALEVSSSVYRAADIRECIHDRNPKSPNAFESVLQECQIVNTRIPRPLLGLFDESVAVSMPHNRVQNVYGNTHGNVSSSYFADQFDDGFRLDTERYNGIKTSAAHMLLPVYLKTG